MLSFCHHGDACHQIISQYQLSLQTSVPRERFDRSANIETLVCSFHGRAKFVSAAHRKVREGSATLPQLLALLTQLQADTNDGALHWLPITEVHIARVESVYRAASAETYLRAADALYDRNICWITCPADQSTDIARRS
jgi:hypothetical protein